jgi:hypothetical protein
LRHALPYVLGILAYAVTGVITWEIIRFFGLLKAVDERFYEGKRDRNYYLFAAYFGNLFFAQAVLVGLMFIAFSCLYKAFDFLFGNRL